MEGKGASIILQLLAADWGVKFLGGKFDLCCQDI
jgi:hypothetical protein